MYLPVSHKLGCSCCKTWGAKFCTLTGYLIVAVPWQIHQSHCLMCKIAYDSSSFLTSYRFWSWIRIWSIQNYMRRKPWCPRGIFHSLEVYCNLLSHYQGISSHRLLQKNILITFHYFKKVTWVEILRYGFNWFRVQLLICLWWGIFACSINGNYC